jgi:hypothetical protein
MNSIKSTMTRDEQRKAYARVAQERQLAKIKKEKEWLAANPHIAAQQEREKEEQRKNRETLRMLKAMKDDEIAQQKKKKKPLNAFAALMDSDTETDKEQSEEEQEQEQEYCLDEMVNLYTGDLTLSTPEPGDLPKSEKKFVWADECDE